MTANNRETLVCASDPRYSENDRKNLDTFSRASALDAIDDFCSKNLTADPEVTDPKFSQHGDWPEGVAKGGKNDIIISVTFVNICPGDTPKNRKFPTGGTDCHRRLANMIIDQCDTNMNQKKWGGSLIESVGFSSSLVWETELML